MPSICARVTYISLVTGVWLPVAVDVVMMQCPFGGVHFGCPWELTHLASGSRHYHCLNVVPRLKVWNFWFVPA